MLEKFEYYFRIIGGKNGRSKYGISARARAGRVVFSIKEPLLTLKQFTYNGHPPPTTRLKSLSKSLWNCPINCDYYSILGVKIFKEVWRGRRVKKFVTRVNARRSSRYRQRESFSEINIELAHAICPYNVNEWEFMASLRTQRIVRLPFSFVWWRIHSS